MNLLEQLKAANPNLPLFDVFDPAFSEYGRVLDLPGIPELAEALGETRIPDQGNRYVASLPELEALSIAAVWRCRPASATAAGTGSTPRSITSAAR